MNQRQPIWKRRSTRQRLSLTGMFTWAIALVFLLGACDALGSEQPVADTDTIDNNAVVATPVPAEEDVDSEATVQSEDMEESDEADIAGGDIEAGEATIITSTELVTGTEVTTDVTVTTDTTVLEQQMITIVITATDMVSDVVESSDSNTVTETEVVTESAELTDETTSTEVEGDVDVTPVAPTPTPTVVVEVTRVVTDTEVVTETVEMTAVATPSADQAQTPQPAEEADAAIVVAFIGIEGATDRSMRASTLLDADFVTTDGDVGGEIQDIVIDMQTGQVVYVLLEYGGIFDVGDTDMPVPMSAFTWSSEDELILNVDGQELEEYPGVSNEWPVPDENDWDLDVRNFWENIGFDPGYDSTTAAPGIRRASDILNDSLADLSFGEGTVEDLIIDLEAGRVSFFLTSLSGASLADDWYVIPFSAFDPNPPDEGIYLNADFDVSLLEQAPTFDEGLFGQTEVYGQGFDDEWRSYWEDAGYSLDMESSE